MAALMPKGESTEITDPELQKKLFGRDEARLFDVRAVAAPGVVPREEKGACKVRPVVDKAPVVAKVKEALRRDARSFLDFVLCQIRCVCLLGCLALCGLGRTRGGELLQIASGDWAKSTGAANRRQPCAYSISPQSGGYCRGYD